MALITQLTEETFKQGLVPIQSALKTFRQTLANMSLEDALETVEHCKVWKTHNEDTKKVTIRCTTVLEVTIDGEEGEVKEIKTTVGSIVTRLMVSLGCERKQGRAPMGWMEHTISAQLGRMKA